MDDMNTSTRAQRAEGLLDNPQAGEGLKVARNARDAAAATTEADASKPMRFRAVLPVIRAAGLVRWAIVFLVLYVVATLIVFAVEPTSHTVGDAAWLMFQVVTTIGLGDFTCTHVISRTAAIVLSLYSVLFLALITGAMVSYCSERMRYRRNKSIAHFLDQLEHLPELSKEELQDLSNKIKRL